MISQVWNHVELKGSRFTTASRGHVRMQGIKNLQLFEPYTMDA